MSAQPTDETERDLAAERIASDPDYYLRPAGPGRRLRRRSRPVTVHHGHFDRAVVLAAIRRELNLARTALSGSSGQAS